MSSVPTTYDFKYQLHRYESEHKELYMSSTTADSPQFFQPFSNLVGNLLADSDGTDELNQDNTDIFESLIQNSLESFYTPD